MTASNPKLTDALLKAALVRRSAGQHRSVELIGDVLTAVQTVPQGHSWGLRLVPQRRLLPVLIGAALLLVALIGFAVGAGSRLVVDDPGDILTQREIVEPFLGLPPEGAAPSMPETGELVFFFYAEGPTGSSGDAISMWLIADGRLIWSRDAAVGVIEQRLTPEGVELLRSEVIAVGRGGEGAKTGHWFRWLRFHDGEQLVERTWGDGWLPERLADPASWLPPSAWADQRIVGYVPRWYAACVYPRDELARLPGGARDLILAHATNPDGVVTGWDPACYLVPTEIARELAATLEMAGIHLEEGSSSLTSVPSVPNDLPKIMVIPVSPDGEPMCLGCMG